MGIRSTDDIAGAYAAGQWHLQNFIKVWPATYATAAGIWDATMAGIMPRASYYPGDDLTFTAYPAANHLSIFHGGNVSPATKVLRKIGLHVGSANLAPSRYWLCDYLGFYAGISWETDALQEMDNTITLPRYTDGKGVRAFIVQLFGANTTGCAYTMNYVNSCNETKVCQAQFGTTVSTGGLQSGQTNATYIPFVELAQGCAGIKQVNSLTVSVLGAGVAVLVLCKPLCEITYNDPTMLVPTEKDFLTDNLIAPIIYDGACLNFLMTSTGSAANQSTRGYCEFAWR